jgi:hypothetical protein
MNKLKFKFVSTPDNFHPCFNNNDVAVSLHKNHKNNYRIAVWGDDDYGLEKDNMTNNEAYTLFKKISDGVKISFLKDNGFKQC